MVLPAVNTKPTYSFRFVPIPQRKVPYPGDDTPEGRLLNLVFGPPWCSICDTPGAAYAVVRSDGMWDGTVVCGGESPCVTRAIEQYTHDDVEPWIGEL